MNGKSRIREDFHLRTTEPNIPPVEFVHKRDGFAGEPAKAIGVEESKDVARAQAVQASVEVRRRGSGTGEGVAEDLITSCSDRCVEPAIKHVKAIGRRDPFVSNAKYDEALPEDSLDSNVIMI